VLDIAIKIYKQKYGVTFSVAMATSKQCIVAPWKIPMQQSDCKFCPIYLHLLQQGKGMPHSIFETRLWTICNAKYKQTRHFIVITLKLTN
jgi:hypothetical protein